MGIKSSLGATLCLISALSITNLLVRAQLFDSQDLYGSLANTIGHIDLDKINPSSDLFPPNVDSNSDIYNLIEPERSRDNRQLPNEVRLKLAVLDRDLQAPRENLDRSWYRVEDVTSGPINNPLDFKPIGSQTNNTPDEVADLLKFYLQDIVHSSQDDSLLTSSTSSQIDLDRTVTEEADGQDGAPASRYGSLGGEYIDHPLNLIGHQYVQGGAGEGRQLLGPDGSFENVQVIKSDHEVPSYCDPPNPCPPGYTAQDGCLEKFTNSASFSREYQAKQHCNCDDEHSLFNCGSPPALKGQLLSSSPTSSKLESTSTDSDLVKSEGGKSELDSFGDLAYKLTGDRNPTEHEVGASDKLETLARTIQNRFGNLPSVHSLIDEYRQDQQHDE